MLVYVCEYRILAEYCVPLHMETERIIVDVIQRYRKGCKNGQRCWRYIHIPNINCAILISKEEEKNTFHCTIVPLKFLGRTFYPLEKQVFETKKKNRRAKG